MRVIVPTLLLLLSLCCALPAAADNGQRGPATSHSPNGHNAEALTPLVGKYHAILIGINNYEAVPKLKTPIGDVDAIEKVLREQYGFKEITKLTDNSPIKPTGSNIVRTLKETASKLSGKDNLLVFYAGHGEQDELTNDGYWIPIDGKKHDSTTWISHASIRGILETERIKVKNFILLADSCYSGLMTREISPDLGSDKTLRRGNLIMKAARKSREVITSGGKEPVVDSVTGSTHSLFAHFFIKALEDNQEELYDMATLFDESIRPNVLRLGQQEPERSRVRSAVDNGGLFVLYKRNVAAAQPAPSPPPYSPPSPRIAETPPPVYISPPKERFTEYDGIILDNKTGLMWLKDANYFNFSMDYDDAFTKVDRLNVAGYENWRLPTDKEFKGLLNGKTQGLEDAYPNGHPFKNLVLHQNYWTATKKSSFDTTSMVTVNLKDGSHNAKSRKRYSGWVWPVRLSSSDDLISFNARATAQRK